MKRQRTADLFAASSEGKSSQIKKRDGRMVPLAVQLRKAGKSYDRTVALLCTWAHRNHPVGGKSIIREGEIRSQTRWAYRGRYQACGCEDPAVRPFCDPACHLFQKVRPRQ